jgi:hypothetical protein
MKSKYQKLITFITIIFLVHFSYPLCCSAQTSGDTLKVMAYNVLDFGIGSCQTPTNATIVPFYADLKYVIQFANADIVGIDKMQCVKTSPADVNGLSSPYFPDTVLAESFNSVFPGRYNYCPYTDYARCLGGNSSIVFYDQHKLGYISTAVLQYWTEDIDMQKFYYKEWFGGGADTTFLYVILCHTISDDNTDTGRSGQDSAVINKLKTLFTHTPNMIYMGDFNTHASNESGYEYITQTSDTNYIFYDPPFSPDAELSYPQIWHSGNADQAYFTTSTRETTEPNSCGTTGGAKDWYDHILLSPWLVNGTNNIRYVRNSYTTIGNDGNRAGISVNTGTNTSAPTDVINALYNLSDKYPVEVTLAVNPVLAIHNILSQSGSIKINNPVEDGLTLHFATFLNGSNITMDVYDVCGRNLYQSSFMVNAVTIYQSINLVPGVYFVHFISGGYSTTLKVVKE